MGHGHAKEQSGHRTYIALAAAALLLAGGLTMDALGLPFFREGVLRGLWYGAAWMPVGLPVAREAWEGICRKEYFSEFTLMLLATVGAFYIGEYPEGVAVMLFYSLGELFQDKAVAKARKDISALIDVRPETATVVRQGSPATVSPQEVEPGEVIEVRPGQRVPLDGEMLDESASFNTSALTGESVPRVFRQGEEVLSGMIATDRAVRLRVTRPFEQSALSRILALVQDAAGRKAPTERFIRKFARIYTPAVTGLAVGIVLVPWLWSLGHVGFTFRLDEWLYRALVFLVISCPCALVVSIPLGYFGGIGAASRRGILFKGGNYLDAVTHIDTVVFDKTGTLTRGTFEVEACHVSAGAGEERFLSLAAAIEQGSTHPVARAVVRYARRKGVTDLPLVEGIAEQAGEGLEAYADGKPLLAGNLRLMERHGIDCPPQATAGTGTAVLLAWDGRYIGSLLLADQLKDDAAQAVEALRDLNITNIQVLSGDRQEIVTTFASRLGIGQAYGDLLPQDKVRHIEELCSGGNRRVAFVGDGLNDAPVLALSHVGIAMGGLGSDAAIETADIVIQTDQPSKVAEAVRIGRKTRRVVWQNIALAFGVKLLVLGLGAAGLAGLWEAVFADVGVALLAIANAVRLQRMIGLDKNEKRLQ